MNEAVLDTRTVRSWRKYPSYQTIQLDWVDRVPDHWLVKRLKWSITSCQNGVWGDEPTGDEDDVGCVRVADFDRLRFVIDDSVELTKRSVPKDKQVGRLLNRGDLLLEKSGGGDNQPVGALVLFASEAVAVCSNFVAKVAVADGYCGSYLRYLHACLYANRINTRSMKQATGIQNLDSGQYFDEKVPFPGLGEQRAIAAFLDRETARIDALVARKQRLIELLEEKRRAIVLQAVTKGVKYEEESRPSKLFWLESFPRNWTMTRLKYVAEIQTGLTLGKNYGDRKLVERPYLRVANVQDGYLDLAEITNVSVPADDVARYELKDGDVLMTEGGDFDKLGRGFVWDAQIPGCLHQNHVFAVRPKQDFLLPHYLAALMTSAHGKTYFTYTSQQSTNLASTNSTKLGNFPIPLPSVERQRSILKFIAERSGRINECIKRIHWGISSLTEYRSALIYAAVTGQIDVRQEVLLDS